MSSNATSFTNPLAYQLAVSSGTQDSGGALEKGLGQAGDWSLPERAAGIGVSTLAFNTPKVLGDTRSDSQESAGLRQRLGNYQPSGGLFTSLNLLA
jgi:hypothetical protein